ncbi:MAG: DUF192 domain-containing protein [Janthinobacterium lividum]
MTTYRLIHAPSGLCIASVTRAEGWWAKGWGVLGRRILPICTGLWLPGVTSVHTIGVRFSLDLLFLDHNMQMVRSVQNVPPGRWLVRASGAAHTLELGVGTLAEFNAPIRNGDGWRLEHEER